MRHIKQVVLHEAYDPDQQINDVALMELDQPIKCNDYIQPACIPDSSVRLSKLTACFISGWGVVKKYCENSTATSSSRGAQPAPRVLSRPTLSALRHRQTGGYTAFTAAGYYDLDTLLPGNSGQQTLCPHSPF